MTSRSDRGAHLLARGGAASVFVAAAVVAGLGFRLAQYASDRSLWFDESMLAVNILERSFGGLAHTLDFAQAAPIGFLTVEKAADDVFGASEYSLRLFPLVCGLASVPLFAAVARRLLRGPALVVAVALFAAAAGPIYYASEVKQYSGDVFATLVLILLGIGLVDGPRTGRCIAAAAIGATAITISHAAVFVGGGIAFVLFSRFALRRDRTSLGAFAATIPWLASGIVLVILTSPQASHLEASIGSGSSVYAQGTSLQTQLKWLREVASGITRSIGLPDASPGSYLHWPVILLGLAGLVRLARRRPLEAGFLVAAFPLIWIASALHKYPILDRTVMFFVPAAIIFVAEGIAAATAVVRTRELRVVAAAALGGLVLAYPAARAATHLVHPRKHEEIKAALTYIRAHWRPGDALFVDPGARFALRYYLDCGCLRAAEIHATGATWRFGSIRSGSGRPAEPLLPMSPRFLVGRVGVGTADAYLGELASLRGRPRVWILVTHLGDPAEKGLLQQVLDRLDRSNRRLATFSAVGAEAYLYDLRLKRS